MRLMYLLRYKSRHSIYFAGDGARPQLNPLSSTSHTKSGKRTKRIDEPLWIYRLRKRWFAIAGRQRCGRRDDLFGLNLNDGPLPDTWNMGPDGNRTCSYCGSIHCDDLMKIARLSLTDDRYGIEGTTKNYKVYVRQPGVRNASEGAIKFYMQHAPAAPSREDQELFAQSRRLTREREDAKWKAHLEAMKART